MDDEYSGSVVDRCARVPRLDLDTGRLDFDPEHVGRDVSWHPTIGLLPPPVPQRLSCKAAADILWPAHRLELEVHPPSDLGHCRRVLVQVSVGRSFHSFVFWCRVEYQRIFLPRMWVGRRPGALGKDLVPRLIYKNL